MKIMFNEQYGLQQAVLEKRKTMTRRLVKCPKQFRGVTDVELEFHKRLDQDFYYDCVVVDGNGNELGQLPLPYEIGDVVAISQAYKTDEVLTFNAYNKDGSPKKDGSKRHKEMLKSKGYRNKMYVRAEYMPHHIRITDLWFEHLQDISDEDCLQEGITKGDFKDFPQQMYFSYKGCKDTEVMWTPQGAFHILIDKISGKGTWDKNPWVVVYTFDLVD